VHLEIDRSNLHHTQLTHPTTNELLEGQARLRIERFGLSANNITYAAMGDAMSYWDFFPSTEPASWGRLPVWGYATVTETASEHLSAGSRLFGYVPCADELVIEVGRADSTGVSDVAGHRAHLPSVYNRYELVDASQLHRPGDEAIVMLLRPLFVTSFVVDDFLGDHELFGAANVVLSSASAKTTLGVAKLLRDRDVKVIGLTSPGNLAFCRSLNLYDELLTYDDVEQLEVSTTVYVDVAGDRTLTRRVHRHLGDRLAYSMIVGDTHWDAVDDNNEPLVGPRPTLLFAPDQITKRRREWGREGFEANLATKWHAFCDDVKVWMTIEMIVGPEAVRACYESLLQGRADPRLGFDCTLI
jgi:hypothetical protein